MRFKLINLSILTNGYVCRNPTLRQVWGWDSHSQKWELGVLRDSCNFRAQLQRSKHLLWSKERSVVKWQFDSRPQKVKNRPDPSVCRWSETHHWKALEESYKFALDLVPIRGRSQDLWAPKVPEVQIETVFGLLLGSPRNKSHLDVGAAKQCRKYYMGEGGCFPRVRAVVSQVSPCCPWFVPTPKVFPKVN